MPDVRRLPQARRDPLRRRRVDRTTRGRGEIRERRVAGSGWYELPASGPLESFAICERSDDYCATSFLYCRDAQPVPRLDLAGALADIARRPYETPSPFEAALGLLTP
jgi:hypothetical protein